MSEKDVQVGGQEPEAEAEPVPDPVSQASDGSREPGVEVTDVITAEQDDDGAVAGDPHGDSQASSDATQAMEGSDVYVILPEGEGADIPVVATETVEAAPEIAGVGMGTESLPEGAVGTESLPEGAVGTEILPGAAGEAVAETGDVAAEDSSLDDLTADLDDDILAEGAAEAQGLPAEELSAPAAGGGEVVPFPETGKRAWLRIAVPAAAAVLLAAGGLLYWLQGGPGAGPVATPAGPLPGAAGTPPEAGAGTGLGPVAVPGSAGDLASAAREAFRAKLLLAIQLGYGGEVRDE
ncbi:MAG: hypothetical protein HY721_13575 [Planctomycetes bacterium]|nr:hypothetical protein [Planctomycetota bacterium]